MPRSDSNYADQKTDIFALGSTIYYMMTGYEPFPELNPLDDNDEAEIVTRYKLRQFPRSCLEQLTTPGIEVITKLDVAHQAPQYLQPQLAFMPKAL
jgi:serine/threonine protein kinase